MEVVYVQEGREVVERCIYRGEGNAHLALSLPDLRRILRIKKRRCVPIGWTTTPGGGQDWKRDIAFYRRVMVPLLEPFVDDVLPVTISPEQIEVLEEKLAEQRPEYRKHKCLENNNAALFSDYAYLRIDLECAATGSGGTFSIEIKPKQGFRAPGADCCPFCFKQREKLKLGKIDRTTQYCPLDLFSGYIFEHIYGDEKRMKFAILNLLENPQNNLQLFKEGNLRYGEKMGTRVHLRKYLQELFELDFPQHDLLDNFVDLLKRALTQKFPAKDVRTLTQRNTISNLPTNCVLQRILSLQRYDETGRVFEFNPGGYDYVEQILSDLRKRDCVRCVISDYIQQRDAKSDVQIYDGCEYEKCNRDDPEMPSKELQAKAMTVQEKFAVTVPHYVAKIAKDSSLMITLKKVKMKKGVHEVADHHFIHARYGMFLVDVKVLDLYPKPQK